MATANVKAVITAEDRASSVLKNFGDRVGSVGSDILNVAKKSALAFTAAAGAATAFAVKSAADFEQNRVAFEVMLGSVERAQSLLKQLSDFARTTPFELPQVVNAGQQLLAYGFAADDILPTLKALGNVSRGNNEIMGRVVLAFGQVRAATKLTGMELRQFTEAGIPLLEELTKITGKSAAKIKEDMEGGVAPSFEQVKQALFNMSSEGGRFFNLMERQSKTFAGTLSNIRDNIGRVAREIVGISDTGDIREGSIFAILSKQAQAFLAWLDAHKEQITATIQGIVNFLIEFGRSLVQFWRDHKNQIIGFFTAIVGAIQLGIEALRPFFEFLISVFRDILLPTIMKNKDEFIALGKFLGVALLVAISAVILALAGLGAILAALIEISARIRAVFVGTFNFIKNAIQAVIDKVGELNNKLGGLPGKASNSLLKYFSGGLLGRQHGGSVSGGQPYMVGEAGPEMFVPSSSGKIIPNNKLQSGGSQTINMNVNVGVFAGSAQEKRRVAVELWEQLKDVANKTNKTPAQMLGV